ncbi:MAG TPA: hypothetical protein VK843_08905 [Planctomycetota bacterium]|nr:hypothetical protein [Planctomycetota bacterium]
MKSLDEIPSRRPFPLFATVAAAIFVGGSGTVLVHHLLEPVESPRPIEASAAGASMDPRLVEALMQLAQELREARSITPPLAVPASMSSQRSPATESGESAISEFTAAVRELRAALQQTGPGATANPPPPRLPHEGLRAWLPELAPEVEDRTVAYTRQHLFWSEQQILDRYGLPDQIDVHGNGGTRWWYQDNPSNKRSFAVVLYQGRVISVEANGD